jgi:site-specific DNA-methyltransferase (adenine-specific)
LRTFFKDYNDSPKPGQIALYANGGKFFIDRKQLVLNDAWVDKYKVLTSKGYNGGDTFPHKIIGTPILAEPGSACTETYIVCGVYDTLDEAKNFENYMRTRFFRFLVALRKNTQDVTQAKFKFVPLLDMKRSWSDEELFREFGLDVAEVEFINSMVREMPPQG